MKQETAEKLKSTGKKMEGLGSVFTAGLKESNDILGDVLGYNKKKLSPISKVKQTGNEVERLEQPTLFVQRQALVFLKAHGRLYQAFLDWLSEEELV